MSILGLFRRSKKTDQANLKEALQIIESFQKLIEFQALHFDREKREVWLVREAFWDGKDENWQSNFCKNLKIYMDITWDTEKNGENLNPIHIFSINIDTKKKLDYITSYLPDTEMMSSTR